MDWNIASRQSRIPLLELPKLHQKAVDLLEILQRNLPDKTAWMYKYLNLNLDVQVFELTYV
jgi:hypothetical protein